MDERGVQTQPSLFIAGPECGKRGVARRERTLLEAAAHVVVDTILSQREGKLRQRTIEQSGRGVELILSEPILTHAVGVLFAIVARAVPTVGIFGLQIQTPARVEPLAILALGKEVLVP